VSCGEDNESGNDDREGQSGETFTHDDDDDDGDDGDNEDVVEEDSYNRQVHVKEIQEKAISRFPARCRTKSCKLKLQGRSSQAFQKRLCENGSRNIRLKSKATQKQKIGSQSVHVAAA